MDITHPKIARYLDRVTPRRDSVLCSMETYAHRRSFPIVGPQVGQLLWILARTSKATRVLELGSGFGYSAYWFAKGMGPKGRVYCTEGDPENVRRAEEYFRRGRIGSQITILTGDALDSMDEIDGTFDIIFNDIDKHQYPAAFRKALPRLRKGGLLITDNVLWSGKVTRGPFDAKTAGIVSYNRSIFSSKKLFSTIVPVRDGVAVSVRV